MPGADYRYPDFGFEGSNYFRKPWRLRWRWLPLPLYYGADFRSKYAFVTQSLHWTEDDLTRYQWDQLSRLLGHAYRTVPHYREVFSSLKILPSDIKSFADYSKLPTVNRWMIQRNPESFLSSESRKFHTLESTTSGTTDSPLKFLRTQAQEQMRRAVSWRHFNLAGYKFKQPMVSLNHVFLFEEENLLYKYEPLNNNLFLNGRMVLPEQVAQLHKVVKKFNPVIFHGHPSAMAAFAQTLKDQSLEPFNVKAVLTYSEMLSAGQIRVIKEQLSQNVFDYYANRENSISAAQLSCGSYHINSEFVHMELESTPIKSAEENYFRVIGTNLHNFAMPLLRYDADDLALELGRCRNCQLPHPTIKFVGGRTKNFLVSSRGILNCKLDDTLHDLDYNLAREIQVEQVDLENIIMRVVISDRYDRSRDEEQLLSILKNATKGWFKITIEYVETIPVSKGFKKSKVISRLGAEYLQANN